MHRLTARTYVPRVRLTARGRRPVIEMRPLDLPIAIREADPASLGEELVPGIPDTGRHGGDGLWQALTRGVDNAACGIFPRWRRRPEYADYPIPEGEDEEFPHDPAATRNDLANILSGEDDNQWIAATQLACAPFAYPRVFRFLRDPGVAPPDAEAIARVTARVAAYVERNLRTDGERTWVRVGGIGVDVTGYRRDATGQHLLVPRRVPAWRIGTRGWPIVSDRMESALRHLARIGYPNEPDAIRAHLADLSRCYPGAGMTDDDVRHRINHLTTLLYHHWTNARGQRASTDAPALADRLLAAATALAPWAGLGALNLIERNEWEEAAGHVVETATLLRRSHPWMGCVAWLNEAISYCEEVVLPHVGAGFPDAAGLGAVLAELPPPGPRTAYGARDLLRAGVFAEEGGRLATVDDILFGEDGRIASLRLDYKGSRVVAPFAGFRVAIPERHDDRWTLRIPRALTEGWAVAAANRPEPLNAAAAVPAPCVCAVDSRILPLRHRRRPCTPGVAWWRSGGCGRRKTGTGSPARIGTRRVLRSARSSRASTRCRPVAAAPCAGARATGWAHASPTQRP